MQYYAGLDIHKKTCQAIICTEKGDIVKQGKIPTKNEEIQEFFSDFRNITIAIEAFVILGSTFIIHSKLMDTKLFLPIR